jgi:E3 ubiquitin-protein ligase RNF220/Zinc finger, C3HC4 type (RING finger)
VGESYSWCGQTRIRATTLIEGNLSSTVGGIVVNKAAEDEDTEVNIDGDDDTQAYGASQYCERDIILLNKDDQRLRDLVIGEDVPSTSSQICREAREENNQNVANSASTSPSSEKIDSFSDNEKLTTSTNDSTEHSSQQIIESLKGRIREYENFIKNKPKCLICLDDFKKPVVSICCWHVHCEECWLYTLGCRKLCPQCNMITSASDLRRIYL